MGKYSENPIDNIQGYLDNIEMLLEKQAKVPAPSSGSSELKTMKEDLSSIRSDIAEICKDNALISASMNTVAEAIGTVPTENERKQQHQEDLLFIINNAKKQVTVNLSKETLAKLDTVSKAGDMIANQIKQKANELSKPLDELATTFEYRIGKVVEKKAKMVERSADSYVYENWFWRFMALISLVVLFLLWVYPKIKEIDFPDGAKGFFYGVMMFMIIILAIVGIYKLGKMNGNGYF